MKITLIILLISFEQTFAQMKFFIRPTLNMKAYTGSVDAGPFVFHSNNFASNTYFKIKNNKFYTQSIIDLGLHLGCKLKNTNTLIEFGYNKDGAGISVNEIYTTYQAQDSLYLSQDIRFKYTLFVHRFSLQISKPIKNTLNYITYGLGIMYNPSGFKNGVWQSETWSSYGGTLNPNVKMDIDHVNGSYKRWTPILSLGVSRDVVIKNKYIVTCDVFYTQGFKTLLITSHKYIIRENGTKFQYIYGSLSKGSGLYLQLSRQLMIKKKKKTILPILEQ